MSTEKLLHYTVLGGIGALTICLEGASTC